MAGIQEAIQGFLAAKQQQVENDRQNRLYNLALSKSGYQEAPNGGISEMQATPTELANTQGLLSNIPGFEHYKIAPGTTRRELSGESGLLGKAVGGELSLAKQMAMFNANQPYRNARITETASGQYKNVMNPIEDRINAADRVKAITAQIKNGTLIPSQQLGNQLSADITSLNTGKPPTVFGMGESNYRSAAGDLNKLLGYASGTVKEAITPEQLDQLDKETDALKKEWLHQHAQKFKSFSKRQPPEVRQGLEDSYNAFRENYDSPSQSGGLLSVPGSGQQQPIGGIKMIDPSGRSATVPKEHLQDAIKDGWKQAQ